MHTHTHVSWLKKYKICKHLSWNHTTYHSICYLICTLQLFCDWPQFFTIQKFYAFHAKKAIFSLPCCTTLWFNKLKFQNFNANNLTYTSWNFHSLNFKFKKLNNSFICILSICCILYDAIAVSVLLFYGKIYF